MTDSKWVGKERVLARMRRIPDAVRQATRAELHKQAAFLTGNIKAAAPRDEGDLAESVEWHPNPRADKISVIITAGVTQDPDLIRKARSVEFGRPDMEAQPFFYPVYRAFKRRMKNAVNRAAKAALKVWGSGGAGQ